jgi:hypothetical protein
MSITKEALYLLDAWERGADANDYFSQIAALRQAIEQAEKQKPVAYRKEAHGMWFYIENKPSPPNDDYEPLYTAPPKREIEQAPESWMGVSDNPYCDDVDCNDPNGRAMRWHNKLLELRKQVALDGLAETSREIEQEPVGEIIESSFFDKTNSLTYFYKAQPPVGTKLYTAPPKREFVGLTDEEVGKYSDRLNGGDIAKEVEAKLREKNT